jgi:hypothetical protein
MVVVWIKTFCGVAGIFYMKRTAPTLWQDQMSRLHIHYHTMVHRFGNNVRPFMGERPAASGITTLWRRTKVTFTQASQQVNFAVVSTDVPFH